MKNENRLNEGSTELLSQFQAAMKPDPLTENSIRDVPNSHFSFVKPKLCASPKLVHYSKELAEELAFNNDFFQTKAADFLSGNALFTGSKPYAMNYGGHQFGQWAGQLGDGRAINLGEKQGKKNTFQMQLKGAGPTPYSRHADGLAVMRSSVREYLCSEAMHNLGIPTTRALSLVSSGDWVMRDMFYNGQEKLEPGAVVCRVAPHFIRFGNFEILNARQEWDNMRLLLDYCIAGFFPHLQSLLETNPVEAYLHWFQDVADRTCDMVVHWMRVGFVHGVMNTDNMSISGLTIDYGPYGWLDNFDPNWTPNTSDSSQRRYRYSQQPGIAQWNLLQLANAIFPLVKDEEGLKEVIRNFASRYQTQWLAMMRSKMGLFSEFVGDQPFFDSMESLLERAEIDMTLFYRELSTWDENISTEDLTSKILTFSYAEDPSQFSDEVNNFLDLYADRLEKDKSAAEVSAEQWQQDHHKIMCANNPKFILRNYLSQQAIEAAEKGDYSEIANVYEVMLNPYDEQPEKAQYAQKRPDWAKQKAGCSMLSCSS